MSTDTLPKVQAQRRLALLWFILIGLSTALLGIKAHGAPDEDECWKWFSPYAFPLLLLMVGTLRADETPADAVQSTRFYFRLCWGLLLFYGLFLLGAIGQTLVLDVDAPALVPTGTPQPSVVLSSLKSWGLPLTAVQSVVSLALGTFFVAPNAKATPAKEAAKAE